MTYATDRLFEEVAYVAYHFHWPMDTILDLENVPASTVIGVHSLFKDSTIEIDAIAAV